MSFKSVRFGLSFKIHCSYLHMGVLEVALKRRGQRYSFNLKNKTLTIFRSFHQKHDLG